MNYVIDNSGALRVVKHALELKKPVMLLNIGPSRADGLPGVEKIDMPSGSVLGDVARAVMYARIYFTETEDLPTMQWNGGTRGSYC